MTLHPLMACCLAALLATTPASAGMPPREAPSHDAASRQSAPNATALRATEPTRTMSWSELSNLPMPPPGQRIAYGEGPQQFGELRIPEGRGPFPVIVLIHGGCWLNAFDYQYITRLAAWFSLHGVATWTIEYRRIGDAGAGWPGTFADAAKATDFVRQLAKQHPLDATRTFAAGHSAGGQLALWLASRGKLPADSVLHARAPLPIRGVLGLAAITDMARYRIGPADSCHSAVDAVLGGDPATVPQRYAQTSPAQRLPLGVPQVFIQGERDPIVDAASVRDYVERATRAGDHAIVLPLPLAGHFESSVPIPQTEPSLVEALRILLDSSH
ncbi:alpha/beta hydrolase [soil metagenome]